MNPEPLEVELARLRAIVERCGEGLVVIQNDQFVFANNRATELLQSSREEMMAEGYLYRIHPEDRPWIEERRKQRLAGQEVPNRYEVRALLANGDVRWLDIGVTMIPWGDAPATLTFFSDVTERKQAHAELQRASVEREAILHNALVGIVLSVDRHNQWVNDKFAEMVGYSREELIGVSSAMLHADRDVWAQLGREQRAALVATGTSSSVRQLKRRNGELFWVHMEGQCVRKNDPDAGVIWTFLDITERLKAEQDTQIALEQQKELNTLRSRFVAMTSHEFRTPLSTILTSAELLKYYDDRLPKAEKLEIIKTIEDGVQRMKRMLDRVLLLGKVEAHMLEFRPHAVNLLQICQELVEDTRTQHPLSRSEITTDFSQTTAMGMFDEKLLHHIFGNLLSNALKYSPQGGAVAFSVVSTPEHTVFQVSDQGIGIPPDEIPHLFESFHRASNVGDIQGTGLGLAIVKNAVDLHGGSIQVTSAPGLGTTFTVRL
ncbi:PAS domain-containing sensor histidine kinase [Rhodoferax sp. AJA081-3]|uniref:sensor histidine kinase n=1 Tax=Rhodoferax sp. AJA081-3 TaxID=2752316 RepID=UPI001ADF14BD|nr:PAS domain-containing sensor histidine kinase [Rhodoferax sp. AJA081-3]QTN28248.1 PAS domain-containing sensor histidine kinase [Rhodoferax sp. AJA081-3]